MTQAASKIITVDEFIKEYADNERYELIDGELIDMKPTGQHEQVVGFVGRKLNVQIDLYIQIILFPIDASFSFWV